MCSKENKTEDFFIEETALLFKVFLDFILEISKNNYKKTSLKSSKEASNPTTYRTNYLNTYRNDEKLVSSGEIFQKRTMSQT